MIKEKERKVEKIKSSTQIIDREQNPNPERIFTHERIIYFDKYVTFFKKIKLAVTPPRGVMIHMVDEHNWKNDCSGLSFLAAVFPFLAVVFSITTEVDMLLLKLKIPMQNLKCRCQNRKFPFQNRPGRRRFSMCVDTL